MMTEAELRKGGVYTWRKGDPRHESTIRVTQVTRRSVRAVSVTASAYQNEFGLAPRGSFWNPKSFILDECTPVSAGEKHAD